MVLLTGPRLSQLLMLAVTCAVMIRVADSASPVRVPKRRKAHRFAAGKSAVESDSRRPGPLETLIQELGLAKNRPSKTENDLEVPAPLPKPTLDNWAATTAPKAPQADYVCIRPRPGLKVIEREQCFPECKRSCAESLRRGQLYLPCLASSCLPHTIVGPTPFLREHGAWVTMADRFPIGMDQFPSDDVILSKASTLKPTRGFAMAIHPATSWRRFLRFNLTSLRQQGFSFDYLTAEVGMVVDWSVPEDCGDEDDGLTAQRTNGEKVTLAILSNRGQLFSRTVNTKTDAARRFQVSVSIPENVKTLRLQVFRAARKFPYSSRCTAKVYAVWSQTALGVGQPLLPGCGSKCNIDGDRVFLSCLLGACPGTSLSARKPSPYATIEKHHQRSEVCVDCTNKRRRHLPVRFPNRRDYLPHLIGAQADSRIAFDLARVRELMSNRRPFNVLRMTVGIDHRALRKCLLRPNGSSSATTPSPTPSPSSGVPLTFNVLLDDRQALSLQQDLQRPTKEVTLYISQTTQNLRLEALAGSGHRLCNQAIWGEPRLEYNPVFDFPSCNRECGQEFTTGQYPLTCMLGRRACPGTLARGGSRFAHIQTSVGVDTAGAWPKGRRGGHFRRRIRFSGGRKSFKRGLGLEAPGAVIFNLTALREHGLAFNFLQVVVGLDVNSLLPHCASHALRVGGEARVYGDGKLVRSWLLAHEHARRAAHYRRPLPYYGTGFRVFLPVAGIGSLKFVALNPLNSACSSVSFADAKFISLQPSH